MPSDYRLNLLVQFITVLFTLIAFSLEFQVHFAKIVRKKLTMTNGSNIDYDYDNNVRDNDIILVWLTLEGDLCCLRTI